MSQTKASAPQRGSGPGPGDPENSNKPDQSKSYDYSDAETSVSPSKSQQEASAKNGQQKPNNRQNKEVKNVMNPCCCDCTLSEGVAWISAIEFVWGLISALVVLIGIINYQNAKNRFTRGASPDELEDLEWKKYGDKHIAIMIAVLVVHIAEVLVSCLLMATASRRVRSLCFLWIGTIIMIIVVEIIITIVDPFSQTYLLHPINLFRIYFIFVVWCLAAEIKVYPNGPPIEVIYTGRARPGSAAVIVPTYGYGYRYYPYYYYHPYGYYNTDAAIVGAGTGLAIGAMAGGACTYDTCYY